jgi:hypothetical protein
MIDPYGFPERRQDPYRLWRPVLFWSLIAFALVLAWCTRADAHDHYTGLQSPSGADCCDNRDCRSVPWRENNGVIEYNLDGIWVRSTSVNEVAPIDGQAHACWRQDVDAGGGVVPQPRCLFPPGVGA